MYGFRVQEFSKNTANKPTYKKQLRGWWTSRWRCVSAPQTHAHWDHRGNLSAKKLCVPHHGPLIGGRLIFSLSFSSHFFRCILKQLTPAVVDIDGNFHYLHFHGCPGLNGYVHYIRVKIIKSLLNIFSKATAVDIFFIVTKILFKNWVGFLKNILFCLIISSSRSRTDVYLTSCLFQKWHLHRSPVYSGSSPQVIYIYIWLCIRKPTMLNWDWMKQSLEE